MGEIIMWVILGCVLLVFCADHVAEALESIISAIRRGWKGE
jgi:hypothetical protein